ncbi:MAG: lysophospholipid acyltransferase family protein [Bacteroidia bacterium]
MIYAKHSKWANLVMGKYLRYILRKDFHDITYINTPKNASGLPVLLLPNHFSWWDGFIFYDYNRRFLGKEFYLMMLEEELAKRPFFSQVGAFSIRKKSKDIIESLAYTRKLLQDKSNMVTVFPQGKIHSIHAENMYFESGIAHLINGLKNDILLLQAVVLPDYFANRKPVLHIYFREKILSVNDLDMKEIQMEYNAFYKKCRLEQGAKTC